MKAAGPLRRKLNLGSIRSTESKSWILKGKRIQNSVSILYFLCVEKKLLFIFMASVSSRNSRLFVAPAGHYEVAIMRSNFTLHLHFWRSNNFSAPVYNFGAPTFCTLLCVSVNPIFLAISYSVFSHILCAPKFSTLPCILGSQIFDAPTNIYWGSHISSAPTFLHSHIFSIPIFRAPTVFVLL